MYKISIFLLLFLVSGLFIESQEENKDNTFTSLSEQELLDRTEKIKASYEEADKILKDSENVLATFRQALENLSTQIKDALFPSLEKKEGASLREKVIEEIEHLNTLWKFWGEKRKFLVEKIAQLEQRQKYLQESVAQIEGVFNLLAEFFRGIGELELRLAQGKIEEEKIKKILGDYTTQKILSEKEAFQEKKENWKKQISEISREVQESRKELEKIDGELAKIQIQLAKKKDLQEKLTKQQQVYEELSGKNPKDLLALLSSLEISREKLGQDAKVYQNLFPSGSESKEKFLVQEKKLASLSLPNLTEGNIELESTTSNSREAEKAWKICQAIFEDKEKRLKIFREIEQSLKLLIEESENSTKVVQSYINLLLRYQAIGHILERNKEEGKIEDSVSFPPPAHWTQVEEDLGKTEKHLKEIGQQKEIYLQRQKEVSKEIEKILLELEAQKKTVVQKKAVFQEEQKWSRWIEQVEKLKTSLLKEQFEKTLVDIELLSAQIDKAKKATAQKEKNVQVIITNIENLRSPLVLRSQEKLHHLYDVALQKVTQMAQERNFTASLKLSRNLKEEDKKSYLEILRNIVRSKGGEQQNLSSIDRFSKQLDFFSSMLTSIAEEEAQNQKLLDKLNDLLQEQKQWSSCLDKSVKLSRQAYGAAFEFQMRLGRKELKEGDLPAGVEKAADRKQIISLDLDLTKAIEEQESTKKKIETINALLQKLNEEEKVMLGKRLDIITRKLGTLRKREQLEKELSSPRSELSETESKRFEQKIAQKMEEDNYWWESLLMYFESSKADELTQLMKADYNDLVEYHEKMSKLDKSIALTRRLIESSEKEKELVKELYEKQKEKRQFHLQSMIKIAEVEAKLKPESFHVSIIKELEEQTQKKLESLPASLSNEELKEYIPAAADEIFRAWILDLAGQAWKSALEQEISKLGIDAEIGGYAENIGQIEARQRQLQPKIYKLQGIPLSVWTNLDPLEKPQKEDERYRFLNGEIGYTRNLRLQSLISATIASLLSLIIIPLIALILIRSANKMVGRFIARITRTGYYSVREREQRMETLVGIFSAVWTTVVVIVAGIYMLKQFRIDITPLIASAGVAGLAFAFGAQTLIRDYFYGFFILLENQYLTGDLVEIHGVIGEVRKITLRLTIVRSIDGTVHFFPNGTITKVSNRSKIWSRAIIEVGVAYKESIEEVTNILNQVAEDVQKDPLIAQFVLGEHQVMGVESFDNNSITLKMWIKTTPGDQFKVAREVRKRIKVYFDHYGIEIPFPQRVLHQISPEDQGAASTKASKHKEEFLRAKENLLPEVPQENLLAIPEDLGRPFSKKEYKEEKLGEEKEENPKEEDFKEEDFDEEEELSPEKTRKPRKSKKKKKKKK